MIHRRDGIAIGGHTISKPIIKKMHWPYPVVWIVPLLAAVAAGFYFRDYLLNRGPQITLTFNDGSGLKEGETKVMHRGVQIGEVTAIELSQDHASVLVHVRLQRSQDAFARQGAFFWIVRPEISYGGISGLNTVLSGPFIDSTPGNGAPVTEFTGLPKPPAALGQGLRIVLHSTRLQHVQPESLVYYRGIQVGIVQSIGLNQDADGVDLHVFIQHRYETLVRANSQFWIVNGIDVKAGLLSGVEMKVDSLRAIISGGVTFNSPDDKLGQPVSDGAEFALYDEPKKEWLNWAPKIHLSPDDSQSKAEEPTGPTGQDALNSAIKGK